METKREKREISMDEVRQNLSPEEIRELDSSDNADDYCVVEGTTVISNKTGLHARPASVFVQTASKFKSKIQIKAKGKTVDAKSILMIMAMGLTRGTEITIHAEGPDAHKAVATLVKLLDDKFGEE